MPEFKSPALMFRRFKRSRQIVGVLAKYGFRQIMDQIRAWQHINVQCRLFHRCDQRVAQLGTGERIRLALQELGPTFIKMGQILSTRPDMVPPHIVKELEKLQAQVPPFPSQVAKEIVRAELNRPIEEVFASFDDEPVAAASLAQVHRATLVGGQTVAVKIRRPGIVDTIEADISIMRSLAGIMERRVEEARFLNTVELINEIHKEIKRELNFKTEANNQARFERNFAGVSELKVPHIYEELCTSKMLVMEYVEGINISKTDQLASEGYDLKLIARRCADIFFKSSMEHGFFHADPHPGNMFVLPNNVICLLDFGMMGTLSALERASVTRMIYGLATRNEKMTARALLELVGTQGVVNEDQFEKDLSRYIQEFAYVPLGGLRLGDMLQNEVYILRTYNLRFPTNLVWILKAIATVENITSRLDPQTNLVDYIKPFAAGMLRRQFSPWKEARELSAVAIDFIDLLKDLPYETRSILRKLRECRIKMEVEQMGQDTTRKTLNRVGNRLAVALVIAALLVGSSLLVVSQLPPLVSGISIIGITGFGIAAILGLLLEFSIMRSIER
jgi:ubiquinone biosynthesis protein